MVDVPDDPIAPDPEPDPAPDPDPDPFRIDQSGWSTTGNNSPMAGRDQHNHYYGTGANGDETKVVFGRVGQSSMSARGTAVLSVLASLATIGAFVVAVITAVAQWGAGGGGGGAAAGADAGAAVILMARAAWIPAVIGIVLIPVSVAAWRYWLARKRRWPIYYRRFSPRRPLIPSNSAPSGFVRVRVQAECQQCAKDNRPGIYGRLVRMPGDVNGTVSYRCTNKHLTKFRGRSVFVN